MFTGIIEAVGQIAAIDRKGGNFCLKIQSENFSLDDVRIGDSIATNGVCLTVVKLDKASFWADLSGETLARTSFAQAKVGTLVNLEKALTLSSRLGGHLVSAHVDGVAEVISRKTVGNAIEFWVKSPQQLGRYIAEKGSVAVDGISLTVNGVRGDDFILTIVPHTLRETTMDLWQAGAKINLEVDLLARYLERLMEPKINTQELGAEGIDVLLKRHGFMR